MLSVVAKCDGSGNSPRGSSCAAVIFDMEGQVLIERATVLPLCTNNVAEYKGVLLAIQLAMEIEADELEIFSDSKLIVNQVKGGYKCKDADLRDLRDEVWEVGDQLDSIYIDWIPREQNKRADHLCRVALDASSPPKGRKKK